MAPRATNSRVSSTWWSKARSASPAASGASRSSLASTGAGSESAVRTCGDCLSPSKARFSRWLRSMSSSRTAGCPHSRHSTRTSSASLSGVRRCSDPASIVVHARGDTAAALGAHRLRVALLNVARHRELPPALLAPELVDGHHRHPPPSLAVACTQGLPSAPASVSLSQSRLARGPVYRALLAGLRAGRAGYARYGPSPTGNSKHKGGAS